MIGQWHTITSRTIIGQVHALEKNDFQSYIFISSYLSPLLSSPPAITSSSITSSSSNNININIITTNITNNGRILTEARADQLPPSDLDTASVAGEATNASTEMAKPEETLAAGEAAKPEPDVKKTLTDEEKAANKRRLDEPIQFSQEIGTEEELPSKKQRKCPDLPAGAAAYWNLVRDGLDTQVAEIKKCRATEFHPARDRLREGEKELQEKKRELWELEKMVKGLRAAKNKAQAKIDKLDADIKQSKSLLQTIEKRKY
ncbi:uncharacterized protein BHQ10_008351 [Talaromyces amestolkiae]|uniref:Uncharacterized protein n=1 Tax=Talaromyces amestolkiae TaxID=1196081 RepID=A0A364L982_TALAM|nr:uncharacterized protein BHQ10_008351 [Talaromyces amestolkiae]RAO72339.1 hypothetical protein BHQ10_008351 [Talaromyces amestolkiae]